MDNFHDYNSEEVKTASAEAAEAKGPSVTEASELQTAKKKRWPLFFFLLPALLLTIYDLLVATDVLPTWIYFEHYRVKVMRITEDNFLVSLALIAYVALPIVALILAVKMSRGANADSTNVGESPYSRYPDVTAKAEVTSDSEAPVAAVAPDAEPATVVLKEEKPVEFPYSRAALADNVARSLSYGEATVYSDGVTLADLARGFVDFASKKGLSVPESAARSLLGAMAASKLLYVIGAKDRKIARRTVKLLSEYFGIAANIESVRSDIVKPEDLSVRISRENGFYSETDFIIDVYTANHYKNDIRFAALDDVDTEALGGYFTEYMNGADVPTRERYATVVSATNAPAYIYGSKLRLPSNLWYVIIPTDEKTFTSIPVQAMPVSLYGISLTENISEAPVQHLRVSLSAFTGAVRVNKENCFIPEEYWKKIDMLESYVAEKTPFALGNKEIRSIEAYAAVVIAAGGSVNEAVDGVLASKVIPALGGCEREALGGEEAGVYALVDRVFGLDNMPLSHDCLRKLGIA